MNDAEIVLQVKINETQAVNGLSKLQSKTRELSNSFKNAGKNMTKYLTLPIVGLMAVGVKYNATVEQLTTSFETMTGSAKEAADIVERLKKIGSKTPFEFTDLAETTKLLMNYGMTADDAIKRMRMLGDISQGSAEKMNRIATAYGQMSSAGKVNLEDIKQMIEAGFNPLKEISVSTGESMLSLYDRISKGKISVDEITNSMKRSTSEGGKYFGSMEAQSKTLQGQLSTLKDEFYSAAGTLTESLLPALKSLVNWFTKVSIWFSSLSEQQRKWILIILGTVAVLGPLLIIIGSITSALTAMSIATGIAMLPLLAIIAIIGALIVLGIIFRKEFTKIFKGIANGFIGLINSLISGLNTFIKLALAPINAVIKGINIPLKAMKLKTISTISLTIPNIPKLAVGTDRVKSDGLAMLHKGEAVQPASVVRGGYSGGNGTMSMNIEMGDIYLDGQKVGRAVTPYVTKTVKLSGGRI